METSQKLLTQPGNLLDLQGNLTQTGWARQPILDCNLENAGFYNLRFLQPLRVKCWDYYGIFTPTHFFSFTIADIGYIGSIFAYVVNFETHQYHEETLTIPLARGVILPRNSTNGESIFDNGKVRLHFQSLPDTRRLEVNWQGFEGKGLSAEATFHLPPEHESMVIVIPIKGKRFYYNRKVNCMPVEGEVNYGGEHLKLERPTCLGGLDWGRGVWEYDSFWVWASANGFLPDQRSIGLNLGFGFGDTSAATENALILDGRIHKLEQVDFQYNAQNFMLPWTMKSPDGHLSLTFVPFLERVAKTNFQILRSEVHQMFGRYSGIVMTDQNETIQISNLVGFAEEHHARW
jgi:hypothetical protein